MIDQIYKLYIFLFKGNLKIDHQDTIISWLPYGKN